jgi:hypothetical protein
MLTSKPFEETIMSTSPSLPLPIPLAAPWPLRVARAVRRVLGERRWPRWQRKPLDEGFAHWDARMLDDIGAPPEWRRAVESAQALCELERASWRMHGMHAPLGSNRY